MDNNIITSLKDKLRTIPAKDFKRYFKGNKS